MAHLTDHKIHRVLTRFPWRRRKPRGAKDGNAPIAMTTPEGERYWADPSELVRFDDPGPALVWVALHSSDAPARALVCSLVLHHAQARGIDLPPAVPGVTTAGLEILVDLIETAGLDPRESLDTHPLGTHTLGEILRATWAIAAATEPSVAIA